jgi:cytochrome bd-type quinol oxidase subunit 1
MPYNKSTKESIVTAMKTPTHTKYIVKISLFFTVVATLLIIALTGFWLQRTFFNTERFTQIASTSIVSESSRQSIGTLVAERVFANRPALESIFSDRLSSFTAGILATDSAQKIIQTAAQEAQLLITSPRRDPVVLNLTSIKTAITGVQSITQTPDAERRINIGDIPDSITLIDTSELPNVHNLAVYVLWLGPISLLIASIAIIWWILRATKKYRLRRVQIVFSVLIATAIIAVVLGPLIEPAFIAIGRDAASQTLLRNLYEAFTLPFTNQALLVGLVGVIGLLSTTLYAHFLSKYSVHLHIQKKNQKNNKR